tara:strand:- start:341 stop:796 length:456 start_codon:yes stop_codon:yes gene_type:complete
MAKTRSNDNIYPSRYSPDVDKQGFAWVTGRQYIVELICENKALKEKKDLPRGFYTKGLDLISWQKFYQQQIKNRSLTKLIKTHTIDKIIAFLRDNKYIMSLRPKWVHEKLDEYKYIVKEQSADSEYDFKQSQNFNTNNTKKSILSRLEELE